MKKVVVVSYPEDKHAQYVIQKLKKAGAKVFLLNLGKYPHGGEITLNMSSNLNKHYYSEMVWGGKVIKPEEVSGIWWRRPNGEYGVDKKDMLKKYIDKESQILVKSISSIFSESIWISHPDATLTADRKPIQLLAARKVGFRIPETCISNSPEMVIDFIKKMGKTPFIVKPVGSAFARLSKSDKQNSSMNRVIYTKIASKELILDNIDMIKNCPIIFQEAVAKDCDIRVTVVGEKVFATAIDVEGDRKPEDVDWRDAKFKRKYSLHILPDRISKMCVKFTQSLGLKFGCIDLAFSKKGGYIFFEINPQGQWLPSEIVVGHDISGELVKMLLNK